ncbi:QsdR family transcriptional regulator [Dactylosporangium fulvum]|uniref:QsdR family transcriptional regulator n=1 Tax=Dactylosporangium fulvum TaxID=53359 RepID=A0ABY5VQ36_9ACTN|nr:QsdR family transcriptional regulator [Dactylosporangium fulvum]UWP79882.1 QsdR family transcriptional regulator [Dactylosporangium fulvum]
MPSRTPLQIQLADGDRRPTALDAFRLARADFLAGRRLDIQALAQRLGVNRVTLHRWVGTREQLLVEVIWSLTEQTLEEEWVRLRSRPGPRVPELVGRFLHACWSQPGARRHLEQDNDMMMRLLTLTTHGFQPRLIALLRGKLADDIATGRITTPLPLDELAYATLRIAESFHYRPTITGEPADPDGATRVLGALLRP